MMMTNKYRIYVWAIVLPVFLFLLLLTAPLQAASKYIGINSSEMLHYDSSVAFVDLFRTAEPFNENREFTRGNIQYDKNGWVTNLNGGKAGTYFARWLPWGTLPQGNYVVRYDGVGKMRYTESAQVVSQAPGRDVFRLGKDKNGEISAALIIEESDPANPVRNIRITLPGGICANDPFRRVNDERQCPGQYRSFEEHSKQVLFNPDFLSFMRNFRTIRFMNMSGITRNNLRHWWMRPHMDEATWGGKEGSRGAPVEVMVRLANTLNADAWFNLPHRADNDFVRNYAQYVKDNLRPNLKAYIEYTNEPWNTRFSQARYLQEQGMALGMHAQLQFAGLMYYAKRSKEIFQTWEQVFGGTQRLVRVLGGWSGHPGITPQILKASDVYKHTDVFAIGPYFYADQNALMGVRNTNDVFNLINGQQRYSIDSVLDQVAKQAELVKPYGVKLVAYEGGQHLVHYGTKSKGQHPNRILQAAQHDPRMEQAYIKLLQGFRQHGDLFMAFSAPRIDGHFGFWGVKTHINEDPARAPKFRALQRF